MHAFDIELADSDRAVYQSLHLRVARHPSETSEYLWTRVLAYCLEFTEGIAFSRGLSEPDEPAIAVRDLTGVLRTWIDVGAPEPGRLHRAGKAAARVAVYAHRNAAQLAGRYGGERIHRVEMLELYALDAAWLSGLTELLARRMQLSITVAGRHIYLASGAHSSTCAVERLVIPKPAT